METRCVLPLYYWLFYLSVLFFLTTTNCEDSKTSGFSNQKKKIMCARSAIAIPATNTAHDFDRPFNQSDIEGGGEPTCISSTNYCILVWTVDAEDKLRPLAQGCASNIKIEVAFNNSESVVNHTMDMYLSVCPSSSPWPIAGVHGFFDDSSYALVDKSLRNVLSNDSIAARVCFCAEDFCNHLPRGKCSDALGNKTLLDYCSYSDALAARKNIQNKFHEEKPEEGLSTPDVILSLIMGVLVAIVIFSILAVLVTLTRNQHARVRLLEYLKRLGIPIPSKWTQVTTRTRDIVVESATLLENNYHPEFIDEVYGSELEKLLPDEIAVLDSARNKFREMDDGFIKNGPLAVQCLKESRNSGKWKMVDWPKKERIGSGAFGHVYVVKAQDSTGIPPQKGAVAMKCFAMDAADQFFNEVTALLYLEQHKEELEVKNFIVGYHGMAARTFISDGGQWKIEWRLALEYCSEGSLRDYLKQNTLDWPIFYRMAIGITTGLSYLHSEHGGGVAFCRRSFVDQASVRPKKFRMVHRDVASKNVLVRCGSRGDVVLSDFGMVMIDKEEDPTKPKINPIRNTGFVRVGTRRYYAPELMAGALNLSDPIGALIQTDAYACSLVLWECLSRVLPAYPELSSLPAYKPPLEDIAEDDPSAHDKLMKVHSQQLRPKLPQRYHDIEERKLNRELVSQEDDNFCNLCHCIEEMWHHEPDCRITVACAKERLERISTAYLEQDSHLEELYSGGGRSKLIGPKIKLQ